MAELSMLADGSWFNHKAVIHPANSLAQVGKVRWPRPAFYSLLYAVNIYMPVTVVDCFITLHTKLSGAVYCNRSCLWVCVFVGLLPQ